MGNLSFSSTTKRAVVGGHKLVCGKVTFSSSYATGGDSYSPGTFGLSLVHDLLVQSDGTFIGVPVSGLKVKLFTALGTESGQVDRSGVTLQVWVLGD
jgi:hypothetical protein